MNDIDLSTEALLAHRAKAEAASPGPWVMGEAKTSLWVEDGEGYPVCRMLTPFNPRATAIHIAANSPDVVMAHIDEILRLWGEVVRLEREVEWLAHNVCKGCPPVPPERLPDCDNEEHPHDCASCWREAARKAVEEGVPHA